VPLEMTCRVCRQPFEPTWEDVLAGPDTYRTCPGCRSGDALKGYVRPEDPGVVT